MSSDGNCGQSGQTNLIFCLMLPVGVVLCMPGQYQVFPALAAIIATRRRGMFATGVLHGFLSIYPARLHRAHQDCGAGCPYWWLHGPIHPKYVRWAAVWRSCSCSILLLLPCWRKSRTTQAQWGVASLPYRLAQSNSSLIYSMGCSLAIL